MVRTPEDRYARWRLTALIVWTAIGVIVLLVAALWGLGRIIPAIVPFALAFVIVFLLNVPVRWLAHRGMKRSHATLVCFVAALALVSVVVTLLGPTVARQVSSFAQAAPRYLSQVQKVEATVEGRVSALVLPPWLSGVIRSASTQLSQFVVTLGNDLARIVLTIGSHIATGLLDIFLSFVIAFWVLADLPKIREELIELAGPRYEADAEHLLLTVTRVLGGYLQGQTIASLITAAIATIGFAIFHVPYAIVLGIIAFIFNFAPYVGPVTTGLIAGLLGLFVSPGTALAGVLSVIVAQNVTDGVIVPRVMSSRVDLHPTLVIFSLLVGGALFGVPGLLFAIPVAAIGKGLFVYYYERRTDRQLSTASGALFRRDRLRSDCAPENEAGPATTCETDSDATEER